MRNLSSSRQLTKHTQLKQQQQQQTTHTQHAFAANKPWNGRANMTIEDPCVTDVTRGGWQTRKLPHTQTPIVYSLTLCLFLPIRVSQLPSSEIRRRRDALRFFVLPFSLRVPLLNFFFFFFLPTSSFSILRKRNLPSTCLFYESTQIRLSFENTILSRVLSFTPTPAARKRLGLLPQRQTP